MSNIVKSIKKIVDKDEKKEEVISKDEPSTALSPIDRIASRSLIDVVKDGAFSGLTDDQRKSATFHTGTVLGASVFELTKAFDTRIDQGESYKRGATGLIGLFEIAFSAKRVLDGLHYNDQLLNNDQKSDDDIIEEHDEN